ncbi:hypothetical protein PanWU01x14_073700 [Parasponia andersonii]|uniref:Uncharacterized protein n=1 Tax=Parasponia andersonii TaxID=3476 RepID=A0A2P5DE52_PARAD|nr:hypothetical protein PanWU01x14_073700 [Parasponia andersonii]
MHERGAVSQRRRQSPFQQIVIQPEVLKLLELAEARRNLSGELVVREVDQLELRQVRDPTRNVAGEAIGGEIEVPDRRGEVAGNGAGEAVLGGVEDLKAGEVSDLRREIAGEGVVLEEQRPEKSAFGERGRDRTIERVGAETQLPEHSKVPDVVTESATELDPRQSELRDSVVGAPDSAPIAWSRRRGGIPAAQRAERVVKV